jgi:hypothetical protein
MQNTGMALLQNVAERILAAYLRSIGAQDVETVSSFEALGGHGVDVIFTRDGARKQIKVKPDPYFGTDASKVNDRSRAFYRANAESYAFEAVANTATRAPGWIFSSPSDEIYYYRVALLQQEDEIRALMSEPDEVFFSELGVERDDLQILQMSEARAWFETHFEEYTPRPVMLGGAAAWYRLVPRRDIEGAIVGISNVGPVFERLVRA